MPNIKHLFNACLRIEYHSKKFKQANTIVLRKPNKPNYSSPKAYRSIALLNILGKALESIIANKLSILAEANGMLPMEQMGARKGRSTKIALQMLIESVYTI